MSKKKAKPPQDTTIQMRLKYGRDIVYAAIALFALAVGCAAGLLLQKCGVIAPENDVLVLCIGILSVLAAAAYLIRTRAEGLELTDQRICAKYSLREVQEISAEQVHHVRRNLLGEIVFYDDSGRCILTAMRGLSDLDRFQDWLERHGIAQR